MDKFRPRPMIRTAGPARDEAATGRRAHPPARSMTAEASLCKPSVDNELERLDGRRGCHYLPMDVFVDVQTSRAHFRASAIRARLARRR